MGRTDKQDDPQFVQFGSMLFGIRAAMVLIRTYIRKHQCNTLEAIIKRWCPDHTATSYIKYVSKKTGIPKDQPIDFADKTTICKVTASMAEVECGVRVWAGSPFGLTPDIFSRAYDAI